MGDLRAKAVFGIRIRDKQAKMSYPWKYNETDGNYLDMF